MGLLLQVGWNHTSEMVVGKVLLVLHIAKRRGTSSVLAHFALLEILPPLVFVMLPSPGFPSTLLLCISLSPLLVLLDRSRLLQWLPLTLRIICKLLTWTGRAPDDLATADLLCYLTPCSPRLLGSWPSLCFSKPSSFFLPLQPLFPVRGLLPSHPTLYHTLQPWPHVTGSSCLPTHGWKPHPRGGLPRLLFLKKLFSCCIPITSLFLCGELTSIGAFHIFNCFLVYSLTLTKTLPTPHPAKLCLKEK